MSKALTLASLGKNLLKTTLNKQAIFSVSGVKLEQKRYVCLFYSNKESG
jgi:hypothetical protein